MEAEHVQEGVASWCKQLVEGTVSWRAFMEMRKARITSTECAVREQAMDEMVSVLCQLPSSLLCLEEIDLMLSFLLSRLEDSALAQGAVLRGIQHLVMSCALPVGVEKSVVQKLFIEGDFQQWAQQEREAMLHILALLIRERLSGLRSMGVELVLAFIRSVTGERDPRCLLLVFSLFCQLSSLFSIGPFVEDMFDVVACYYPIEFKPSRDTTVSREQLVHGCEQCLLAHPAYAPLTLQLIVEKLNEDDLDHHTKLEICLFLTTACQVLPTNALFEQLDDVLVGLRKVAFNPASPHQDTPSQLLTALRAVLTRLSSGLEKGQAAIDYICDDLLENCEPFVLQVQMGMSNRALGLLQVLAENGSVKVLSAVMDWLVLLLKGESTLGMEQALSRAPVWCRLAIDSGNDALVLMHLHTLLHAARHASAPTLKYSLAQVLVSSCNDEAFSAFCDELLSGCVHDVGCDSDQVRLACQSFLFAFAKHNWQLFTRLLPSHLESCKDDPNIVALLCWSVCDATSLQWAQPRLALLLPHHTVWTAPNLDALVCLMCNNEPALHEQLFHAVFSAVLSARDEHLTDHQHTLAVCMQRVGLLIDDRLHSTLEASLLHKTQQRPLLVTVVYLFLIQTQDVTVVDSLLGAMPDEGMQWHKVVLMGAAVNKTDDYQSKLLAFDAVASRLSLEWHLLYNGLVCRQLLLRARPEGWSKLTELLKAVATQPTPLLSRALQEVLNMDSPWSDVASNRYQSTVLAKQRIFCTGVPLLIEHLNQLPSDAVQSRGLLLGLVSPLLALVQDIADAVSNDLLKLLPLLCEALQGSALATSAQQAIVKGLAVLLKTMPCADLHEHVIVSLLMRLHTVLTQCCSVQTMLSAMDCYATLARRWPAALLLPHVDIVISAVISATASNKRTVRCCAANVRNMWELLPTK